MTLTKKKNWVSELEKELAPFPLPPAKDPVPMRYTVMVCPLHNPRDVLYGYVTTHLSLEDWCSMHKWCLIQCYHAVTRPATAREIADQQAVDLF